MQNPNLAVVSGLPEVGKDPTNDLFCSDDLHEELQLASHYSSVKNYNKLDALLVKVQLMYEQKLLLTNEKFVLALIDSKLHQKEFPEVYRLIERLEQVTSAEKLISIWNEAHYEEEEINIGRRLTPVMKYRVRARFPPPPNVNPPGKPLSLRLSRSSTAILKRWSSDHNNQMPTPENIENLAVEANITFGQVKNWFRRSIAKNKKEQVDKLNRSKNPTVTLNLGLQSAAGSSKNTSSFEKQVESPSKYLKKDEPSVPPVPSLPESDARSTNIQDSDVLEFQEEDFLGYIPAYCIRTSAIHSINTPTVIFDARSIGKKIPKISSAEAAPVCEADLDMAYKTAIQADSTSLK